MVAFRGIQSFLSLMLAMRVAFGGVLCNEVLLCLAEIEKQRVINVLVLVAEQRDPLKS